MKKHEVAQVTELSRRSDSVRLQDFRRKATSKAYALPSDFNRYKRNQIKKSEGKSERKDNPSSQRFPTRIFTKHLLCYIINIGINHLLSNQQEEV
ncbi:hypothetical protein ACP8HI_09590 [Paenibacillus sp. FA6]|uniref:hypothetical protein n=1 Tax=Paenibacillus sp. FA6 TaxID=3413029 RepID=UPI003F65548F